MFGSSVKKLIHIHCGWECRLVLQLWKSAEMPLKLILGMPCTYLSIFLHSVFLKKLKVSYHSNIFTLMFIILRYVICVLETTQMSANKWTDQKKRCSFYPLDTIQTLRRINLGCFFINGGNLGQCFKWHVQTSDYYLLCWYENLNM